MTSGFSSPHRAQAIGENRDETKLDLVSGLSRPAAFAETISGEIQVIETHISWVFLTDSFAYKVKKPLRNAFLDYSTLSQRRLYCEEELRLDSRYAPGLYVGVVPITWDDHQLRVDGSGRVVEYAVKMRRFAEGALLAKRLEADLLSDSEVTDFAKLLANFHLQATRATIDQGYADATDVLRQATDNLVAVSASQHLSEIDRDHLTAVLEWTNWYFQLYQNDFERRLADGFVRECHGDLHVGNVVMWESHLVPFDGIEFNSEFRWIDVLSDLGFLVMDLLAKQCSNYAHLLLNSYLEVTGDYEALALLRWYMVYRAMVRAKVAAMRMEQLKATSDEFAQVENDCSEHLLLASKLIRQSKTRLWITHGLSGSGKSTGAEAIVKSFGAIRIRSDVERKREFGLPPIHRSSAQEQATIYSPTATDNIYARLLEMTRGILSAGYSVVVDATFLKRRQRSQFQELAKALGTDYHILCFESDIATLKRRLISRASEGSDASEADAEVLAQQQKICEPLTDWEREHSSRGSL